MKKPLTSLVLTACLLLLAGRAAAQIGGSSTELNNTSVERFLAAHPEWNKAFSRDDRGTYRSADAAALKAFTAFERTPQAALTSKDAQAARRSQEAQAGATVEEAKAMEREIQELEQAMKKANPDELTALKKRHQELTDARDHHTKK